MRVELLATSAQFPRLPLASTETDTPIGLNLPREGCGTGRFFVQPAPLGRRVGRDLGGNKTDPEARQWSQR